MPLYIWTRWFQCFRFIYKFLNIIFAKFHLSRIVAVPSNISYSLETKILKNCAKINSYFVVFGGTGLRLISILFYVKNEALILIHKELKI